MADLSFAFDNYVMLRLLSHRAESLMEAKFKSVAKIEDKMTREKNLLYEKLVQPNSFYCTFEHAQTKLEAEKIKHFEILGETCQIKPALEPTNIIWENRSISETNRLIRGYLIIVVMFIIMVVFYSLGALGIYMMMTMKYWEDPPGVNCQNVIDNYSENLATMAFDEL